MAEDRLEVTQYNLSELQKEIPYKTVAPILTAWDEQSDNDVTDLARMAYEAGRNSISKEKNKMAENKTCPFCGSDSIEVYTHYGESAGIQYGGYYPECTVCGCRLGYYETREDALKAWNERDNHGRE